MKTRLILLEFTGSNSNKSYAPAVYTVELRNYNDSEAAAIRANFAVRVIEFRKHMFFPQLSTRKTLYCELKRHPSGMPYLKVFTDDVQLEDETLVFWNLLSFCSVKLNHPKGVRVSYLSESTPRGGPGRITWD